MYCSDHFSISLELDVLMGNNKMLHGAVLRSENLVALANSLNVIIGCTEVEVSQNRRNPAARVREITVTPLNARQALFRDRIALIECSSSVVGPLISTILTGSDTCIAIDVPDISLTTYPL
jgi:hypothetical protein